MPAHIDLVTQCKMYKLPIPITEFRFHPQRKWRIDYCWMEWKIGLEVNGGVFIQGRHTTGFGFLKDMEKLNEAQIMGYLMLQFTPQQIEYGEALTKIKEALSMRGWKPTPREVQDVV